MVDMKNKDFTVEQNLVQNLGGQEGEPIIAPDDCPTLGGQEVCSISRLGGSGLHFHPSLGGQESEPIQANTEHPDTLCPYDAIPLVGHVFEESGSDSIFGSDVCKNTDIRFDNELELAPQKVLELERAVCSIKLTVLSDFNCAGWR